MADLAPKPDVLPFSEIVSLYSVESGLVQQKITHILSIRSLAITLFGGVIAGSLIFPEVGLEFLTLILIPFYVLDSVYDAYLLQIVARETAVKQVIAARLAEDSGTSTLAATYTSQLDHRTTPSHWSPFVRAFYEPVRVVFYGGLVIVPILIFLSSHPTSLSGL